MSGSRWNEGGLWLARALVRRPFDDLALWLCVSVLIGFTALNLSGLWSVPNALVRGAGLCISLTLLLGVNAFENTRYRERVPAHIAIMLLLVRVALIELSAWLEGFGLANILYLIVPMKTFLYFSGLAAYVWSFAILGVFFLRLNWAKPAWFTSVTGIYTFLLFVVGVFLTSYAAQLIARERRSRLAAEQLLHDLEVSHARLGRYARQAAESAIVEERNRLAREIHDGLGHYLTAINIQLEKAAVFHTRNPDDALQSIRDARRLSSEALDDVRHSVGMLRDPQRGFPLGDELERLVTAVRSERLEVEISVEGSGSGFSTQVLLALYRVAQEGLTNIQRHAQATRALLQLRFAPEAALLVVRDNGCGFTVAARRRDLSGSVGTYGLLGLEERLALVNGQLMVESTPGVGTTLTAHVPRAYGVAQPQQAGEADDRAAE